MRVTSELDKAERSLWPSALYSDLFFNVCCVSGLQCIVETVDDVTE